ncbi:MAG: hypothetical protein WAO20_18940 [Acidobacteriota bacterium]
MTSSRGERGGICSLLVEHNCCDYAGWVTFLDRETTDIVVHRFEVHPLRMQILRDGHPAAGISLWGIRRYCDGGTCGACYGVLATSDQTGRIDIEDFRPETVRELMILKSDDDGPGGENVLWSADPTGFPARSRERVELPE